MIWKNEDETKPGDKSAPATPPASGTTVPGTSAKVDAFLGRGCKVVGTLTFSGPIEIDGQVEGEIVAQDRLTVGDGAVINARISGADVLIRGTVNGDITATKRLALRRPAKITGNLTATNLSIEEGVIFEGKCSMANVTKEPQKTVVVKPADKPTGT